VRSAVWRSTRDAHQISPPQAKNDEELPQQPARWLGGRLPSVLPAAVFRVAADASLSTAAPQSPSHPRLSQCIDGIALLGEPDGLLEDDAYLDSRAVEHLLAAIL